MIRVILFLCCAWPLLSNAQSPSASFTDNIQLVLDADSPVSDTYVIDIADMEFRNELAAKKFFGSMTDNLVSCTVDYAAGTAELKLALPYVEEQGWGVAEWNNYFSTTANRYERAFATFNNE
jgi:hypothetical protein